jgi:hypothetical protein
MAPSSSTAADILIFALSAILGLTLSKRAAALSTDSCDAKLLNSAFVFVKPHANTPATQALVKEKLMDAGITILSETDIDGTTIDEKKLIDQHYYAIASKATILPASKIPVPEDKFKKAFGESWETVLRGNRACNALEACKRFGCTPEELNDAWQKSTHVEKFGGGFYCAEVVNPKGDQPSQLYVFNAFFMTMRSKFVGPSVSIHCYNVQWDPNTMSWDDFRNKLLGPTDPADGPVGSIRRTILENYKDLGLKDVPNKGDNGVHASASPFEGLAERTNWLNLNIEDDAFGAALLAAGLSKNTIEEWSVDPQINLPGGSKGSVFDALEDMDAEECLKTLVALDKLNPTII